MLISLTNGAGTAHSISYKARPWFSRRLVTVAASGTAQVPLTMGFMQALKNYASLPANNPGIRLTRSTLPILFQDPVWQQFFGEGIIQPIS
jgi:hypothetical protein